MNKVLLTGRLTRDPEMRSLASGKNVTTFTVASNEFIGGGKEKAGVPPRRRPGTGWPRSPARYLGKGQQVAIEGRLQTRSWDDDRGARHWKTEIVASHVEMLSGRKKKDYEAQQAADSLAAQAEALGEAPADGADRRGRVRRRGTTDDDDEEDEARSRRPRPPDPAIVPGGGGVSPSAPSPPLLPSIGRHDELEERDGEDARRRASAGRPRASSTRRRGR